MPVLVDEKDLYKLIRQAIKEIFDNEFKQEIKPRLNEIDKILELLEDEYLSEIALLRFTDIEKGAKTVSLEAMEQKYGL